MTSDLRLMGPTIHRLAHRMTSAGLRGDPRYWAAAERLKPLPDEAVLSYRGRRARFRLADPTFGPWAYRGQYETYTLSLLEQIVRPGWYALDIGANQGLYTLVLSGLVGAPGHVVAVEPSARLAEGLDRLAAECANVTILNAAIGAHNGEGRLLHWGPHAGLSHLTDEPAPDGHDLETVTVVPLDDAASLLPEGRLDFVKIDVEGGETPILEGLAEIDRLPEVVVVETWFDCSDATRVALDALIRRGLDLYVIGRTQGRFRNRASVARLPVESVGTEFEGNFLLTSLDMSEFAPGRTFFPAS